MKQPEKPDFEALHAAIEAGREAERKLASYYDTCYADGTEEADWEEVPVEVVTPPDGVKITFSVSFTWSQLEPIRNACGITNTKIIEFLRSSSIRAAENILEAAQ